MSKGVMLEGGIKLPSFISKIDGGSFSMRDDVGPYGDIYIYHKLGVKPKIVLWYTDNVEVLASYNFKIGVVIIDDTPTSDSNSTGCYYLFQDSTKKGYVGYNYSNNNGVYIPYANENRIFIQVAYNKNTDVVINWLALA